MKEDQEALAAIEKTLKQREEKIKEKEEEKRPLTKKDVEQLIKQITSQQPPGEPKIPVTTVQPTKLQPSEKQKMAYHSMTEQKNICILALLIIITPFIMIFVTMMDLEIIATLIAMLIMIYPAFLLSKSVGYQRYLSQKYGIKPLLMFRSQQQITKQQQPPKQQDQEMI